MKSNILSYAGLAVFVLFILTAGAALVFDLIRAVMGRVTITEWALSSQTNYNPGYRAAFIVALCAFGVLGLAVHFLFFEG